VETDDFISEVEKASGQDLSEFVKDWLESEELHYEEMEGALYLSSIFLKQYLQIDCTLNQLNCEKDLSSGISDEAKIKIINQNIGLVSQSHFNNSIKVRQAIAQNLSEIPLELKTVYESLLNDKSYITIEAALFNLWNNFPQERKKYLDKTNGIQGFSDKNIRILWLTLALITEDYRPEFKTQYFDELTYYTSPVFGFEVRQNAFQYLSQIQACNEACKVNLEQATKHHNWRFSKFAKALLKQYQ
jgi:aminopeptidase N